MRQDVVTKAMTFDWYEVWIEGGKCSLLYQLKMCLLFFFFTEQIWFDKIQKCRMFFTEQI